MQSLCTSHYRYKSLQCCRGSRFGTDVNVTDGAKFAGISALAGISEEHDNWKARLSSICSDTIHSEAIQLELHVSVFNTTVSHTTVRKAGRASCPSNSNISMNYLASSAVASASVDDLVEFREKVGRTASYPAWH